MFCFFFEKLVNVLIWEFLMKIKVCFIFLSLSFVNSNLQSNVSPEGFERFPNYYFVETGTYMGMGIRFALRAKFPEIHSLEIKKEYVKNAKKMFTSHKNVFLWQGDSGKDLWGIIKNLDKPITFWLDGHRGTADPEGGKNTPLLEELEQIKRHPIKNHIIIIDDMHCCETALFDYLTQIEIADKVKEINPEYTIYYVDGGDQGEYKNNIMVAQVL